MYIEPLKAKLKTSIEPCYPQESVDCFEDSTNVEGTVTLCFMLPVQVLALVLQL